MRLITTLALSLAIAACNSTLNPANNAGHGPGCSLSQYHGELVADNGQARVKAEGNNWSGTVALDWGPNFTTRPTDDGQLEVLDRGGSVVARTPARMVFLTGDYLQPFNQAGAFLVCEATLYTSP